MIEDPTGAVFTVFSGRNLQPRRRTMERGCHVWDALLSTDPDRAAAFYGALFNWRIDPPDGQGRRIVRNLARSVTSQIREPADGPEGPKSRWNIGFAVDDIAAYTARVEGAGGKVVADANADVEFFVTDPVGAQFSVKQIGQKKSWLD